VFIGTNLVKGLEKGFESLRLLQKASENHCALMSLSYDNLNTSDSSSLCCDGTLTSLEAKSSSFSNILDVISENRDPRIEQNDILPVPLSRAKSSSDVSSLGKSSFMSPSKLSVLKLKTSKVKQKRSIIQKLSPKITKSSSKNLKHDQSLQLMQPDNLVVRARAEAIVPISDDFFIFSQMHENFREAIAQFITL